MLVIRILLIVLVVVAATVLTAITNSELLAVLAVVLALAGTFATLRIMSRYLDDAGAPPPDRPASREGSRRSTAPHSPSGITRGHRGATRDRSAAASRSASPRSIPAHTTPTSGALS